MLQVHQFFKIVDFYFPESNNEQEFICVYMTQGLMVKIGRRGGSGWRDRGARKGERRDHEPRGGRERWRDGDGEM
jgi:hypothetical protein